MTKCIQITCGKDATMTLNLRVSRGSNQHYEGYTFDKELPYCDNDLGWFYRSFSRKSYNVEILGITVLDDLDDQ